MAARIGDSLSGVAGAARAAPGGGAARAAPTRMPTGDAAISRAGTTAAEAAAKIPGATPESIAKAKADAEEAAKNQPAVTSPGDGARQLTGTEDKPPGPIDKQDLNSGSKNEEENTKQENALTEKLKTPAGIALVAALGLTIALVITFSVKAAEAAKACNDCKDFKITITSINPTAGGVPVLGDFFGMIKPSTVDVAYTCPTSYEPLEGKESFTFKDTGMPEFDDQTFTVEKVLGKNKVQVKCGSSDCSGLTGKKGSINPNCADFNDRFNDQVEKAGEAAGNTLGSFFKGVTSNMGTVIFVIIICVAFYMIFSSMASSNSGK